MNNHSLGGRLALLTAAVIWGGSFIVMKDAVDNLPVFLLLALRFTTACLLLGIVFLPRLRRANRQVLRHGAVCGVLLFGAYTAQTFGLLGNTPGENAFLTAVYCVLVPFVAWITFRKRPGVSNWLAAVICLAGIGLVSLKGSEGGFTIDPRDLLTLLGGVFYALHVTALSHFSAKNDAVTLTIVQFSVTAALSWCLSLLTEPGALPAADLVSVLPQLAFLSVLATAATLLLQSIGQSRTPPAQAAILLSLESVFGVLFSVLLGAEQLTLPLIAGFTLIFVSVIISEAGPFLLRHK